VYGNYVRVECRPEIGPEFSLTLLSYWMIRIRREGEIISHILNLTLRPRHNPRIVNQNIESLPCQDLFHFSYGILDTGFVGGFEWDEDCSARGLGDDFLEGGGFRASCCEDGGWGCWGGGGEGEEVGG